MNVQIFYSFMLNFKNLVFEGFYFEHFKFKDPSTVLYVLV